MTGRVDTLSAGWHWNSNHWRYSNATGSAGTSDSPLIIDENCVGVTLSLFCKAV